MLKLYSCKFIGYQKSQENSGNQDAKELKINLSKYFLY